MDKIAELMKLHNVNLHIDPFIDPKTGAYPYDEAQRRILSKFIRNDRKLYHNNYNPKICSAGRNYAVIAPNGDVFACYGGLNYSYIPQYKEIVKGQETKQFRVGNLFDNAFKLNEKDILCPLPCKEHCDLDLVCIEERK